MRIKQIMIGCLLLVSTALSAQQLKRKSSFGVAYYTDTPDSLMQQLNLAGKKGTLVRLVVPNSTAAALQLQAKDFIVRINETAIESPAGFLKTVQQLKTGDDISVDVLRNNQLVPVKGKVKGRPLGVNDGTEVELGEFAFDNGYIRTILRKPKGKKPLAVIYFIQGISCYSLDNMQPNDPTRLFLDGLIEKGFAIYNVEKAGLSDGYSATPCAQMGFTQELQLFREGYKKLLTYTSLTKDNIFIFGHSLGGIVAPLISQEFQPKGVAVYGTGVRPWHDYLLKAYELQYQWAGYDPEAIKDSLELMKPTFYELFYNRKKVADLINNPKHLEAMEKGLQYDTRTGLAIAGRTVDFQVEINQYDLLKAWKATNSYVLTMFGEADVAAMYPDDHEAIVDAINQAHPGRGTYLFVPRSNHTMQEIGTRDDYYRMQANPAEYQKFASEHFNTKIVDSVAAWILDKLNKKI
jgi:uncharacterized protein